MISILGVSCDGAAPMAESDIGASIESGLRLSCSVFVGQG
jgi:hypothetical protein